MSGYLKDGIRYPKPISKETRLLIDTVTKRYGNSAAPFIAIDREDHIELRCPERVERIAPWETRTGVVQV